jgi:hypothetical protein
MLSPAPATEQPTNLAIMTNCEWNSLSSVPQTSKSAVPQVSEPASPKATEPAWQSAQQVWKPALRKALKTAESAGQRALLALDFPLSLIFGGQHAF